MGDDSKRERFGRYLILDHLVDGGMAKICRARFLGEQADKIVAIKMVQPQFSSDGAFKQMFMDEIKLAFGLQHPNIVQTYDYGLHNDQLFVAMEYCDGRNLKEYFDKLRKRRFVFPVEISTYIISQVCQGLHYAHTHTDKLTGQKFNIIHRDISPHNIMLTFDGSIKVIDFGIAKAETNSEATQAGTIKGKLSYLAPEYLDGIDLDPRYDQFAIGITLWEMLCSRKLFKANNDLAVLKKIQECYVPVPSEINPHVPKELDEIVLKALSKDRENRYPDLDQLNRALMKFLYQTYPEFNATDLAYFAKELFKEEIEEDRKALFEFGKIDIGPHLKALKRELSGDSGPTNIPLPNKRQNSKSNLNLENKKSNVDNYLKNRRKKQADDNVVVSERKGAAGRTQVKLTRGGRTRNIVLNTKTQVHGTTKTPTRRKMSIPVLPLALMAGFAMFFILGPKKVINLLREVPGMSLVLGENKEARKPASDNSKINKNKKEKDIVTRIRLTNFRKHKDKVFLDGEEFKPDFLGQIEVSSSKRTILRVERSGHEHFIKTIEKNTNSKIIKIVETPEAGYGYLKTSRNCVRGEISFKVFGESRVESVPFSNTTGIAFPIDYDEQRKVIATTYTIGLKKVSEKVVRSVSFTIKNQFDTIDLCSLL